MIGVVAKLQEKLKQVAAGQVAPQATNVKASPQDAMPRKGVLRRSSEALGAAEKVEVEDQSERVAGGQKWWQTDDWCYDGDSYWPTQGPEDEEWWWDEVDGWQFGGAGVAEDSDQEDQASNESLLQDQTLAKEAVKEKQMQEAEDCSRPVIPEPHSSARSCCPAGEAEPSSPHPTASEVAEVASGVSLINSTTHKKEYMRLEP